MILVQDFMAESNKPEGNITETGINEGFEPELAPVMEKSSPPVSPPPSIRKESQESVRTPTRPRSSGEGTGLRPNRRFPATPSTHASGDDRFRDSTGTELHPKSHFSLSSLSDFNGSEDSHTERRFLRHYEELESHCIDTFPDFITPWFLRRVNYGPCKAGDIVDLLRFLRPESTWISPFHTTILDPYLASTLEKAVYPNTDVFSTSQKTVLRGLHHFVFSAYDYAQGIFFPSQGQWEEDRRDVVVDSLNLYVEDIYALVEYLRLNGRTSSLRGFVKERTKTLNQTDTKRTFFFAEGGDSRMETEEYVCQMFLALLGLWTVGANTSPETAVNIAISGSPKSRFEYSKNLPFRNSLLENVSLIRETFGVLATPLEGAEMGIEWVRPLQDFDAAILVRQPYRFSMTRDVSRHLSIDDRRHVIHLFCNDAVEEEDSLNRLEGNVVAKILNLDILAHEHQLMHQLLFSSDESRQIAFSLGLVPPRKADLFLRLSAFPNYAAHLLSLRREMKEWRPGGYKYLLTKGSHSKTLVCLGITLLSVLILLLLLAVTGTIGLWIIVKHVT